MAESLNWASWSKLWGVESGAITEGDVLTRIGFRVTGGMDYHQQMDQKLPGWSAQCDEVAPWISDHHPGLSL